MACRAVAHSVLLLPFVSAPPTLHFGAAAFVLAALRAKAGGAEGIRTPDPHNAIVVLYQLSYDPIQSPHTLNR